MFSRGWFSGFPPESWIGFAKLSLGMKEECVCEGVCARRVNSLDLYAVFSGKSVDPDQDKDE